VRSGTVVGLFAVTRHLVEVNRAPDLPVSIDNGSTRLAPACPLSWIRVRELMASLRYDCLSGSPFFPPWLVGILRGDVLLLVGCLMRAVGVLGFLCCPCDHLVMIGTLADGGRG
jgi:hypothetical protein